MTEAINISNVSKSYGDVCALDDVTFSVPEGVLFGLIGPDGAGKTTLYRILTTLIPLDDGSATVAGFDVKRDIRQIRSSVGYMPAQFSLYPDLTVNENLQFFASLFGVNVSDNYDLIAPIFGQLARFPNRRAGALSGGMKQKLALGCALIHRPKILLLDEPTTGVDAVSRSEFWDMLSTLREQDITILVSTSYMDEAQRCDCIALLNKGKIIDVDTADNLTAGLAGTLYNASAKEMYPLLQALRTMKGVADCYTFGATLHIVSDGTFDPASAIKDLTSRGLSDVKVYPAEGNIEDLFIKTGRINK